MSESAADPAKFRELQYRNQMNLLEASNFMDLDFADFEASWPFDQLSNSDHQPFSPLWAFTDAVNVSDFRISADFSRRFLPCNPEPAGESRRSEEEEVEEKVDAKVKIPPPLLELSPLDNFAELSVIIKERMTQALRYFKESTEQSQILVQVWAPTKSGNHYALTTSGLPFVLGPHSNGLNNYRTVSLMYMFAVDGEINGTLGLPGRVFRQEKPEWTPNVQYYSSKEYSRVDHAKHYNVRGTLALPVFEPSKRSCVGVIELIMNSEKINYAPEVDKVCKALELFSLQAVNLKTSQILDHPNIQICNEGRQNALAEILEVLTEVCETYKLPLAQTWIPCRHRSVLANGGGVKKSCSSFDGRCMGQVCMSTTDVAFYVVDAHMWGFRDACAEHHLQKGQGVSGRAFSSLGLCFCRDISRFCKKEYPLVHYARMFGLTGSFSICLRNRHTGDDDYILEFFLPCNVTDYTEQLNLLDSILATMKHDLQNLMVASGKTLEEERQCMEIIEIGMDDNVDFQFESEISTKPQLNVTDALNPGKGGTGDGESHKASCLVENKQTKKTSERKRGKAEKQISLEVLQNFAGSLKDAAKALGVCPTTMKRICRQHGISRWPSRKINKVNRSLTKLKCVIESVQGSDGAFSLTSPVGVRSYSWPCNIDEAIENPSPKPRPSSLEVRNPDQNGLTPKTEVNGSKELSNGISTSHGSCHGSQNPHFIPNFNEKSSNSIGLMFLKDAGSSKDLNKLCPSIFEAHGDDVIPEHTWVNLPSSRLSMPPGLLARQESKTVTIKATFREDIIRFRFSLTSNIVELKEEVAKRLKLDIDTFEIKYLDNDHEWVMVVCDSDLQECLDISKFSGSNTVRLLVHDLLSNPGSSCEGSGEL